MLLLMLMPKRFLNEKPGNNPKDEDGFMQRHGGRGPQLTYQCFQAVSDLADQVRDVFFKRER